MANDYRKNKIGQSGIFRKDADPARQSELYSGVPHERSTHHVFRRMQAGLHSLERRISLLKTTMHVTIPPNPDITNTDTPTGEHYVKNRSALTYVKKPESRSDVSTFSGVGHLHSIPFRFFSETEWDDPNASSPNLLHKDLPEETLLQYSDFYTGHDSEYTKAIPLIDPAAPTPDAAEYTPMLHITTHADINYFMGGVHHPLTLIVQHSEDLNDAGVFPEDPIDIGEEKRFTTLRVVCDKTTFKASDLLNAVNSYSRSASSKSYDQGALPISASYKPSDISSIPAIIDLPVGDFLLTGEDTVYMARLNPAPISIYLKDQTNLYAISTTKTATDIVDYTSQTENRYHKHNPFLFRIKTTDAITDPTIAGGNSYDAYFVNTGTYGFIIDEEGVDEPSMGGKQGETYYSYASLDAGTNARFVHIPENTQKALETLTSTTPATPDAHLEDAPIHDVSKAYMNKNPYTFYTSTEGDPQSHLMSATKNFVLYFTVTDKEILFADGTSLHLDQYLDYFSLTGDDYYIGIPGTPIFSHAATRLSKVTYDKIDNTASPVADPAFTEIPTTLGPIVNRTPSQNPGDGPQTDSLKYISDMFAALIETMNSQKIVASDLIKKTSLEINPSTIYATGFVVSMEHSGVAENTQKERYLQMGPSKYTVPLPICILGDPGTDTTPVYTGALLPTGFVNVIKSLPDGGSEKSYVLTDFTASIKESMLIGYEPPTLPDQTTQSVTTKASSVNLNFAYKEDREGVNAPSIPPHVLSIGHTTAFDGSFDIVTLQKLYTFGDALRVNTVGTHTTLDVTETGEVKTTVTALVSLSLKSTLKFTTTSQGSLHDVITDLFYEPSAGFGNAAPDTNISDTLVDGFSSPYSPGTAGEPDYNLVTKAVDSISRTENYHSNQLFDYTGLPSQGAAISSSQGRVLRSVSPHMSFGSAGTELSQAITSIMYSEVSVLDDEGTVTTTPGEKTLQLVRLRILERENILVSGDDTSSPLANYIRHKPLSGMATDLVERITAEMPFYLNPQTTARSYSYKKRVISFRSQYNIDISYGVVYDAFTQMTYADFSSYMQKGVTTYPSVIDGSLPFDRIMYAAAPSTDIQVLTLLNPSLLSRVKSSLGSELNTPKSEYITGARDPEEYNYSYFAHNLLEDETKSPVGLYGSLGLLGKNVEPDTDQSSVLLRTNPIKIIPFATITLDVVRVANESTSLRVAQYQDSYVPTRETIDASRYLEKVTVLVRNTTTGASEVIDITADYMKSKIDLGLMNVVHKRSDNLDRLTDASTASLARSITDQTYSQQYQMSVSGKAGALSFIPLVKYGSNVVVSDPTAGTGHGMMGTGVHTQSPEGNTVIDAVTFGSSGPPIKVDYNISYDFQAGNMLFYEEDSGGAITQLTTSGITCSLDETKAINVIARQIFKSIVDPNGTGGPAASPVILEHQIEDSPINLLASLGFSFDIDLTFKDTFIQDLKDDGYLINQPEIAPNVNSIGGDSQGVDATSEIHSSGGWFTDSTRPYVEIPVSVNVGYLPLFEHVFNGALPTMQDVSGGFTAGAGSGGGGDMIKVEMADNAALTTLLNSDALKKEKTMVRPGKITIKQTLHRVKLFSKSGYDGSSHV